MHTRSSAVIIGAGSRIGTSLCKQWLNDDGIENVIAISRQPLPLDNVENEHNVHFIKSEYDESSIADTCGKIKILAHSISRVCICNGILHNQDIWPEKRIEELNINKLKQVFAINSVTPILWLKALLPIVKGKDDCHYFCIQRENWQY